MKIFRAVSLGIVFSFSLLIGFLKGSVSGINHNKSIGIQAIPFETPLDDQYNILMIQVDHLGKPNVVLKSVWLMVYYTNDPRVDFFPIFPTPQQDVNNEIANNFVLTDEKEPGSDFWESMQPYNTWWNGYIVMDETAAAQLIAYAKNEPVDEISAQLKNSPAWYEDPQSALQFQIQMYDQSLENFSKTSSLMENIQLLLALRGHSKTNLDHAQLWETWQLFRSYGDSLNCSFPSMHAAGP